MPLSSVVAVAPPPGHASPSADSTEEARVHKGTEGGDEHERRHALQLEEGEEEEERPQAEEEDEGKVNEWRHRLP